MKISFVLAFCLFSGVAAAAETPANDQLQKSADEFQNYKKKSQGLQEKEREILSTIYKMSKRQRRLAQQKSEQLQKREGLEADITQLQKNIQEVSQQIKGVKKKMMTRVRNLHRVNTPTIFQTVFGAQDVTEMDRNARILYKIAKADAEQLRTYRGLRNMLDEQQQNLEVKLAEFEKTQKGLEKQETAIKTTYLAQMALLQKLNAQDKAILSKLRTLRKKAQSLASKEEEEAAEVAQMFETGIYEQKGRLELSVNGVVTQKFGLIKLMQDKIRVYNKGWFIASAPGREVTTVFKGRVAYTGPMDDYNQVVIVDHGDHFYSVYANLSDTDVSMGDEVETQQQVGSAHVSRLFGPGLYFEIRHFSQSEDPAEWFKKSGLNISSLKERNI